MIIQESSHLCEHSREVFQVVDAQGPGALAWGIVLGLQLLRYRLHMNAIDRCELWTLEHGHENEGVKRETLWRPIEVKAQGVQDSERK